MKKISYTAITAALLLCFTCPPATAAPLFGNYEMDFEGPLSVYDFSGSYKEDVDSISMNYTINCDTYGRLIGTGTFSADEFGGAMSGNIQLAGTVKSSGDVVRMNLTFELNGTFINGGYSGPVEGKIRINTELDTVASALTGTASGSVSVTIPGLGKEKKSIPKSPFLMEVPKSLDGEWEMLLNGIRVDLKNRVTGTARVDIDGGKTLNYLVSGKYAPNTDLTELKLVRAPGTAANPVNLSLTDVVGQVLVKELKADLLGQKLNYSAPGSK